MRTITKKGFPGIVNKLADTYDQVKQFDNVDSASHFCYMMETFMTDLNWVKWEALPFELHKKRMVGILREVNTYFIALGTNEAFREHEGIPNLERPFAKSEDFICYTQRILPIFQ